jgi:colicin import membrane protein
VKKPNTGVVVSSVAHVAVLAYAVVGFSHSKFDPAPESITVEVMTTSEFDNLTKGEKTSKKVTDKPTVEAKKIDQAIPEPKPPLPESKENVEATKPVAEPPPTPEPPKPEPKPEPPKQAAAPPPPTPEPKPAELPKPPEKVDTQSQAKLDDLINKEMKKPEPKKPEPKKPVEKKPEKPTVPFDPVAISALTDKRAPGRKQQAAPEMASLTNAGIANAPAGQLALSELNRLNGLVSEGVKKCWSVPAGAKDVADIAVLVQFRMAEDGSLIGQPQVMNTSSNPIFQATAESAVRAVHACLPLNLPPELYDRWKFVAINFDPKDMF